MSNKALEYFNNNELQADVWSSKYQASGEETPDDMHKRLAEEFARIEHKYNDEGEQDARSSNNQKLSDYGKTREFLGKEDIYNLFKDFKYIIPQGSIMYGLGRNKPVTLSNCFVCDSAEDSYSGIMETDQQQAQLMKRRAGVGHDLSNIRPRGAKVGNSAESSTGVVTFMHRYSNTTIETAQEGRRGALMLSIDINHPDVEEFALSKSDETSITGANISIKLTKEFLDAVENDEDYILRWPCNILPSLDSGIQLDEIEYNELYEGALGYYKKIRAKELWNTIVTQARNTGDPGLMFWDNVLDSPDGVYEEYKPKSSNP